SILLRSRYLHRRLAWNGRHCGRVNPPATADLERRLWQHRRIGHYRRKRQSPYDSSPRKRHGVNPSEENGVDPFFHRHQPSMNKQFETIRPVIRSMPWDGTQMSRELLLTREWLVTNGLGGYASGTVSGAVTRRYHGLL